MPETPVVDLESALIRTEQVADTIADLRDFYENLDSSSTVAQPPAPPAERFRDFHLMLYSKIADTALSGLLSAAGRGDPAGAYLHQIAELLALTDE